MNTLVDTRNPEAVLPQYDTKKDTERVTALFDEVGEAMLDFQDSPQFVNYLKNKNIPYDDTLEEYWAAVDLLSRPYAAQDTLGFDQEKKDLFVLISGAPNAMVKQFVLTDERERYKSTGQHSISKGEADAYTSTISRANTRIRDFAADHASVDHTVLSSLVAEAANRGIDPQYWGESRSLMDMTVRGVRTELGFEQKLTSAGIDYQRGTTAQDKIGIDYVVEGIGIDIKSSLHDMLRDAPAGHDKTFYPKRGKMIYFPYDAESNYEQGSFIVKPAVAAEQAPRIASDISDMKRHL